MRLTYKNNTFIIDAPYDHFPLMKKHGFAFLKGLKLWCTPFATTVKKVIHLCEYDPKIIKAAIAKQQAIYEGSYTTRPTEKGAYYSVVKPYSDQPVKHLMDFQCAGVDFINDRIKDKQQSVLIADDMGLGKTIEAIYTLNMQDNINSVLIVCPASLKQNWANEWKIWSVLYTKPVIINYEQLIRRPELLTKEWDALILDECHYLKNPQAKRTKVVVGDRYNRGINARLKLALTGTPILNRPIELFTVLHYLLPFGFVDRIVYAKRYCGMTEYGDMNGASNLDELQEKLRSTIMLRRKKEDVLTQLPAKQRQVIEVEPDKNALSILHREKELFKNVVPLGTDRLTDEEFKKIIKKMSWGEGPAFEEISAYRKKLGEVKLPLAIQHIEDCLEHNDKIVVFAHHQSVIDGLIAKFGDIAIKIDGRVDVKKRQSIVDKFQGDKKVKLFVGAIMASGVGFTLTAASLCIFAELDWVPGNMTQAEDRLHRIGQTQSVLVQYLTVLGSLDATMCKTLISKQEVISKALDKQPFDFL